MVILTYCRNKEEFCELFTKRVHPINLDSLTKEYPGEEKKPFLFFGKIKKRTFWCLTQKNAQTRFLGLSYRFCFYGKILSSSERYVRIRVLLFENVLYLMAVLLFFLINCILNWTAFLNAPPLMIFRWLILPLIPFLIAWRIEHKYKEATRLFLQNLGERARG